MKLYFLTPFGLIFASLAGSLAAAPAQGPTTLNSGSRQLASGNLVIDSALDPSGGNVATSATYTLKPGFVGQLFEVVTLNVSPQTPTVADGASTFLSATATLDDATTLAVPPPEVVWSVLSGPIVSISTGGLASTSPLRSNATASVRGAAFGLTATTSLSVLDSNRDNFGPVAGDGIDDNWQFQFFDANRNGVLEGPEIAQAGPRANPDHDPSDNFTEWAGGFIPTDRTSHLKFQILNKRGRLARLELNKIFAGTRYRIFRTETLAPGALPRLVFDTTPATDVLNVPVEDPSADPATAFYRLFLERSP